MSLGKSRTLVANLADLYWLPFPIAFLDGRCQSRGWLRFCCALAFLGQKSLTIPTLILPQFRAAMFAQDLRCRNHYGSKDCWGNPAWSSLGRESFQASHQREESIQEDTKDNHKKELNATETNSPNYCKSESVSNCGNCLNIARLVAERRFFLQSVFVTYSSRLAIFYVSNFNFPPTLLHVAIFIVYFADFFKQSALV